MIYTHQNLAPKIAEAKQASKTIILVTGFFDLLHEEHKAFLKLAAAEGDILVVGVESDTRARALKGEGRPVQKQGVRCLNLEKLDYVTYVIALPEIFNLPAHHEDLIKNITPDILAVSEHSPNVAQKRTILAKYGGAVKVVHPHNPEVSTTQLLQQKRQPSP